ncbi:MAG: DUF6080 domain-containing protein [Prevotella sp.]
MKMYHSTAIRQWGLRLARPFQIFLIRGEERWVALTTFIVFAALNALQVWSYWDKYQLTSHVGFYTLYSKIFRISGYDAWSCVFLSNGQIYFESGRHPLFLTVLYPLRWINEWAMSVLNVNLCMPMMACLLVVLATWTAVFFFRFLREVMALDSFASSMLTLLLFAVAHVMVPLVCPDHFAFSLFLLSLTLLVAGRALRTSKRLAAWKSGVLLFLTTGIAPTNGLKVLLSGLRCNGRHFFHPRWLLPGVVFPLLLLGGVYLAEYIYIEQPRLEQRIARDKKMIAEKKKKEGKKFTEQRKRREKWIAKYEGKKLGDGPITGLIDISTPRLRSVWDNLLGESFQLHKDYLLYDMSFDRPIFVSYHNGLNYAVEVLIILLILAGIVCGWRDGVMQMVLMWTAVDFTVNVLLGFGLNEVYIMASGWAMLLPVACAYVLRRAQGAFRQQLSLGMAIFAVYLFCYNATLLVEYLLAQHVH